MRRFFERSLPVLALAFLAPLASPAYADPAVGTELKQSTIRDGSNKPAEIPDLGNKVVLILYTDPDEANQNDEFADKVKASNLPQDFFRSVGIANMKDAPAKPDWIIRAIVRSKVKKYNVTILTDPDRILIKDWDLGDCNNKSVAILIGKDKKLLYFKKGHLDPAAQQEALGKIKDAIKAAGGTVN